MEEPVVSKFSLFLYVKVICVALAVIAIIGIVIYNDDRIDKGNHGGQAVTIVLCLGLLGFALFSFLITCIKITVSPDNITIGYPLFVPQRVIPFVNINSANTYRRNSQNRRLDVFNNQQKLVIEYNNGKILTLSAPDFDNYSDIKAAIYKYKYGVE